jgi:hypothetical protein
MMYAQQLVVDQALNDVEDAEAKNDQPDKTLRRPRQRAIITCTPEDDPANPNQYPGTHDAATQFRTLHRSIASDAELFRSKWIYYR